MVGIKDIAKEANVSISTVSYALNGSSRISEKTRERIVEIAKDMNYIPNIAGQNLRRKNTNIIAVHIASYQGAFYGDLLEGMHQKAIESGLELIVCSGKRSRLFLPQKMVDGILVIDYTYSNEELLKYADLNYPIVLLDRQLEHENIRSVLLDNTMGTKEVMQSFNDYTLEKLYFISGPEHNYDSAERLRAGVKYAEAEDYDYEIIAGNFERESGYAAGENIIVEKGKPVGIFALNDEMALGVYNYLKETNYIIGEDVIIRGFDQSQITTSLTPPIKSASYSQKDWGSMGVEMLLKMIENEEVQNQIIPTHFNEVTKT